MVPLIFLAGFWIATGAAGFATRMFLSSKHRESHREGRDNKLTANVTNDFKRAMILGPIAIIDAISRTIQEHQTKKKPDADGETEDHSLE